jgi:hypothetical protein
MHTDRVISMDTGENIGGSINLIEPCYQNLENVITLTIRRAQIRTIGIDFTDQKAKNHPDKKIKTDLIKVLFIRKKKI